MIGDPVTRYREDPVRIIRAVRFAAKLGFEIEPKTRGADRRDGRAARQRAAVAPVRRDDQAAADRPRAGQRRRAAQARACTAACSRCSTSLLDEAERHDGRGAVRSSSSRWPTPTARVAEGKPVAPSFLLACLLWHDVQDALAARAQAAGEPPFPALQEAIDAVFDARIGDISGRGKLARRHARDLDDAAALRAPQRQLAAYAGRAAALPRRLRLPAPARRCRRGRRRAGRLVGGLLARRRRRARRRCWPRRASEQRRGAARAGRRRGARRRRPRRARRRRPTRRAADARRRPRRREPTTLPRRANGAAGGAGVAWRDAGRRGRRAARRASAPRHDRAPATSACSSASAPTSATRAAPSTRRCAALGALPGTRCVARSSLYRSAPVDARRARLLNAVAELRTALGRAALLQALQRDRSGATAASGRTATRRARSTSTCCCTATRVHATTPRAERCRIRACTQRAFVLRAAGRDRAGATDPRPRRAHALARGGARPGRRASRPTCVPRKRRAAPGCGERAWCSPDLWTLVRRRPRR